MAGLFTEWTFKKIIDEVEDIIEEKKQVKHSQIQKRVEALLDNEQAMAKFKHCQDVSFLDYPLPILIQSGGAFQIHKFSVDSSQDKLHSQAIYVNVCGKYCDMAAMASRTLIVNPKDEQKAAYMLANEALELLINSLRVGATISDVYTRVKQLISDKNPSLTLGPNFGFGIGFQFKEDTLTINNTNQTVVKEGMTFHVRIALSNVHKDPARSVVAIGDTMVVTSEGPVVLTSGIQKKYTEISYSLEDSEEIKPKKQDKKPAQAAKKHQSSEESEEDSKEIVVQGRTGASVIKSTRLRSKANE